MFQNLEFSNYPSIFRLSFVKPCSSSHRYFIVFVNHVFSTTAKTNKHTFRCKANPNWESQKLFTGNTATFRVKFTLTKLQKMSRKTELRQITQPHKIISKKKIYIKTKLFILQTHVGQANRKPKAKQNAFQIKKNFRLSAYGTFQKISENFYFLLKG